MTGCYKINVGYSCTYNQTRYGCRDFGSSPPVQMAQIDGKRICGSLGGGNFLNATRPNLQNECPDNFKPCSSKTSAENTICYDTRLG